MTQGSPLVRVCRFGLVGGGRDDLTNPAPLFRMRWGPFACRDPRPAVARQTKATQQFLDVP